MKKLSIYFLLVAISGHILSCAKLGSPPGGLKDEEPPFPKKAKPANYSTHYDGKKITIKFNEFITLKNQFNEFTISPPLEEKPIPILRGKSIQIDLPAKELDSATYTMDFGQSIADNNEGNPLPNFQFVVTKNSFIDSFSVKGKIVDAFTHEPDEELMFVFLNSNLSDTVPYTTIPSYLGRTNPEGIFEINHVAPGTYSVFALKDANNNLLYDLPTEVIGFLNDPITLHPDSFPIEETVYDTIIVDSTIQDSVWIEEDSAWSYSMSYDTLVLSDSAFALHFMADSVLADTLVSDSSSTDSLEFKTYGYSLDLYTFSEAEPFNQYLADYNRDEPEKVIMFFNEPQDTLPKIRLLEPDTSGQWYFLEKSENLDTLVYWLADSNLVGKDSILVELIHPLTDTNGVTLPFTDTLLFRSKRKKEPGTSGRQRKGLFAGKEEEEEIDTLPKPLPRMPIDIKVKKSAQDLHLPVTIIAGAPVLKFDESLIELFRIEDTLKYPTPFRFEPDSADKKKFRIFIEYEPFTNYNLCLYEGCFTDLYTRTIDSVETNFSTQRDDYYGIIRADIQNVNSPVILQLFNKDEKIVKEVSILSSQKISFEFLPPGQYSLKIIFDDNNNGKWDTGLFEEGLQPERVDFYVDPMEVRSNWEVEYIWELSY